MFGAKVELGVCSPAFGDVGLEVVLNDCPKEVKKADEVAFSRAVCADKNVDAMQVNGGLFYGTVAFHGYFGDIGQHFVVRIVLGRLRL